ncbi:MAG: L,D-transpeptidase family protein [Deltaproteobacteria bacterium]|nr:L,D-transpeptidase family protein [Deltaproteobacteria bacterium]
MFFLTPGRISARIFASDRRPLFFAFVLFTFLYGCALPRNAPVEPFPAPRRPEPKIEQKKAPEEKPLEENIERNDFPVAKEDDVVGRLAAVRIEKGDTLPDISRHFSLGIDAVRAANPVMDIWAPEAGKQAVLPLSFILPDVQRKGIVINLAAMRLFQFKEDGNSLSVTTYPIGVGTEERPSPTGQMYIERKMYRPTWYVPASIADDHRKRGDPLPPIVPPGPMNPLGEYALYLNKSSYLIHGTNKPYSIGLRATNGCIRLYPEDIRKLYESTPVKTPVLIVNQPYLIGHRDGMIYMEVHLTPAELDAEAFDKVYAKLKYLDRKRDRRIDWKAVKRVLAEARGIPVPIGGGQKQSGKDMAGIVELKRPDKFYGKPEIPEWQIEGWYILAADLRNEKDAAKLAAVINHQGPHIPARVLSKTDSHRVIAGPFNNLNEARQAAKRLKIDLEIEGILMEPARK